ncbi:methyltransferase domain-containing protein [Phthorimaea operculella]|nr:methyltransferase domain-containing protein [Phthorimaea operculella]
MNLLPKSHKEFSEKDYWNKFFKKRGNKAFEWYGEYLELCAHLHKYIKPKDTILITGCGNSSLSADLYDVGYTNITNIDVSEVVIRQMNAANASRTNMKFLHMDALNMTFENESFTVVLDKGTLDALMPDDAPETIERIDKYFSEIKRVLKLGGRFMCISLLQSHIMAKLLEYFCDKSWMFRVVRCHEAEEKNAENGDGTTLPVFVVVATKFKEMPKLILEVCLAGDKMLRLETPEELRECVKSVQDTAFVTNGLAKTSLEGEDEVSLDLMQPGDSNPRYTLYVVDQKKAQAANKYAVFIVPQGRESEWLFGTPAGRRQLQDSARFGRLVVAILRRGHVFESLDAVKEELTHSAKMLIPYGFSGQIPFLSLGSDVGRRVKVHQGSSKVSGDFVIEDVDVEGHTHRRLVYLDNQLLVQSEARLKTVDTLKVHQGSSKVSGDFVIEDVDVEGHTHRRLVYLDNQLLVQSEARLKTVSGDFVIEDVDVEGHTRRRLVYLDNQLLVQSEARLKTEAIKTGSSKVSGDFVIEDVDVEGHTHRRLVYLDNQLLVQSEARLKTVSGDFVIEDVDWSTWITSCWCSRKLGSKLGSSKVSGDFVIEDVDVEGHTHRRLVYLDNQLLVQSEARLKTVSGDFVIEDVDVEGHTHRRLVYLDNQLLVQSEARLKTGERHFATGSSKVSGDFVIEDVDVEGHTHRRLVYLDNQLLVQSEARLKTVSGDFVIEDVDVEGHTHRRLVYLDNQLLVQSEARLKTVNKTHQGSSKVSGDFVIEDVDLEGHTHRRLVYLDNQLLVQSKARLKTVSEDFVIEDVDVEGHTHRRLVYLDNQLLVQSEARLKTVKRKNKTKLVVDFGYISTYHTFMCVGVQLSRSHSGGRVAVLGLGGGGLCMFLKKCYEDISITAVDLDPAMLEIAKNHFELQLDEHLQVQIKDGVDFLNDEADAVDLDPAMLEIAKNHFELQLDEHLQVQIQDGVDFLRDEADAAVDLDPAMLEIAKNHFELQLDEHLQVQIQDGVDFLKDEADAAVDLDPAMLEIAKNHFELQLDEHLQVQIKDGVDFLNDEADAVGPTYYTDLSITAVDLDPAMLEIAKNHFELQLDEHLQVQIKDGVDFLKDEADADRHVNNSSGHEIAKNHFELQLDEHLQVQIKDGVDFLKDEADAAVDLDPAMLEIAKNHFELQLDEHLQVQIKDGVDFLKDEADAGHQYSTVMFDMDSKDRSVGLSCPPRQFLDSEQLENVKKILTNDGHFILNLVCRDTSLQTAIMSTLKKHFKHLTSVKLYEEVNDIIFATNSDKSYSVDVLETAAKELNGVARQKKLVDIKCVDLKDFLQSVTVIS